MPIFPVSRVGKAQKAPQITVRASPRDYRKGILSAGPLRIACALGRSGVSSFKREGDGATPLASMAILNAFTRGGAVRMHLPNRRIRADDGWCDASTHGAYNRRVRLPFSASTESMWRQDRLYDAVVVLDWNVRQRARHRGSAIFLHVARPGYAPTEGCVAVSLRDMARLAPFLAPGARLVVRR